MFEQALDELSACDARDVLRMRDAVGLAMGAFARADAERILDSYLSALAEPDAQPDDPRPDPTPEELAWLGWDLPLD